MRRFAFVLYFAFLFIYSTIDFAGVTSVAGAQQTTAEQLPVVSAPAASASATITLSSGTKVEMFVTRPLRALTAKVGDTIYAQTSYPVVVGMDVAIPAGTYVEGAIESVTKPTRRSNRAEIDVLFTQMIFANGYVVPLPGDPGVTDNASSAGSLSGSAETEIAITIQTTAANDLLLDDGADIEMTLGAPLALDATQIAAAVPLSHVPQPGQFKSATQCRNTPGFAGSPGTPGTPDTVIPGNPGTPSTTIPGGPGMPDTVIPGTPATPDTIIPGTPGTPGTPDIPGYTCPAAPMVVSCAPVAKSKQPLTPKPVAAR